MVLAPLPRTCEVGALQSSDSLSWAPKCRPRMAACRNLGPVEAPSYRFASPVRFRSPEVAALQGRDKGTVSRLRVEAIAPGDQRVQLKSPSGEVISLGKESMLIGSDNEADLNVEGENVYPQHARLEVRGGRAFCTALVGDEDDLTSKSYTWMNGMELRTGVQYMVGPGASLSFGDESSAYQLDFEEMGGMSDVMQGMMKAMASQFSDEVKDVIEETGL